MSTFSATCQPVTPPIFSHHLLELLYIISMSTCQIISVRKQFKTLSFIEANISMEININLKTTNQHQKRPKEIILIEQ